MSGLHPQTRRRIREANNYSQDVLEMNELQAIQAMRPYWQNFDKILKARKLSYIEFERRMKAYGFPVRRESISLAVRGIYSRFSFRYLCACADVLGYTFDEVYTGRFQEHDKRVLYPSAETGD
jgi:transcriptional regulator with XRE-family HTH domain